VHLAALRPDAPSPWIWHPHLEAWALVAVLAAAYLTAIRRAGPRYVEPGEPPATAGQRGFFFAGLVAMLLASDWPIHDLAERHLYSVHMAQHMLLTLVVPPLLLAGTPHWMARLLLKPRWLMALARRLTRPLIALLVYNGLLVLSHWPAVVDATLRSEPVHFLSHSILFGSAIVMWWPVLSPLPEIPRASYPAQMLYLFLQTIVPTVPASFLTFAEHPVYHFYETLPRWFSISVVEDQRIAGLGMKIVGGLLLWGVITVLFFRWSSKEERPEVPDVLEWQQVERELNQPAGDRR
jgi:putative membrane protein